MFLSKKVLGVCPARSGSKGIKLKNLRKVNGKSLIAITGEFSRKSNMIDASVITSDSKKMLDEGIKWGFDYGLLRPQHLSTDSASSLDTWIQRGDILIELELPIVLLSISFKRRWR